MSSGAISAQIIACQNQIGGLKREIQGVSQEIAKQQAAIYAYQTKTVAFFLDTERAATETKSIAEYLPVSVLSKRYEEKTNIDFSEERKKSCEDKINATAAHLRRELDANEQLLHGLQSQLASANSSLGSLNSEYANAVTQEQEEQSRQNQGRNNK